MKLSKFHNDNLEFLEFQREALVHLAKNKRSILSLFVGGGKTLISLSLFAYSLQKFFNTKCVFITRKRVIRQIPKEMVKFFNNISYSLLYETKKSKRIEVYRSFNDMDVLFCSYDNVKFDFDEFIKMVEGEKVIVVIDEASTIKNSSSGISKKIQKICKLSNRSIAMTGTPVMNRLEDIYNILYTIGIKLITKSEFNSRFVEFKNEIMYMRPWLRSGNGRVKRDSNGKAIRADKVKKCNVPKKVGYKNVDLFYKIHKDFIFSKKKSEVTDLPPFSIKYYDIEKGKDVVDAEKFLIDKYGKGVVYGLMNIASSSPSVILENDKISSKEEEVLNILSSLEESEKALIYHPFKKPIHNLKKLIENKFGCDSVAEITGSTKDIDIEKDKFINGSARFMVMTDSGIQGVDGLQVANHVILFGINLVAGQLIQLSGRISRVNTKHITFNLHVPIVRKTIDEDLWKIVQNQLILINKISPDSLEEGLIDESIIADEIKVLDEVGSWIKQRINKRYLGKL